MYCNHSNQVTQLSGIVHGVGFVGLVEVEVGSVRWPSAVMGVLLLVEVGGVRWPSAVMGVLLLVLKLLLLDGRADVGGVRWPSANGGLDDGMPSIVWGSVGTVRNPSRVAVIVGLVGFLDVAEVSGQLSQCQRQAPSTLPQVGPPMLPSAQRKLGPIIRGPGQPSGHGEAISYLRHLGCPLTCGT